MAGDHALLGKINLAGQNDLKRGPAQRIGFRPCVGFAIDHPNARAICDNQHVFRRIILKTDLSRTFEKNLASADRTIIVRPTYMVGPADKTNRFIHWPIRLSKGGEILVPGKATDPVQYIDVRDVAEWMIRLAEQKQSGIFNAVGPKEAQNMHAFVEEAAGAFEVESSFVKIDDYDFLQENGIEYIVHWILTTGTQQGSSMINNEKAIRHGLTFRPLTETVKDTHDWWYSDAISQEKRDEVEQNPDSILGKEAALIEKWKTHSLSHK